MKRSKTPTFIHKIKLQPSQKDFYFLRDVFNANRQLYNYLLGVGLKKIELIKNSKEYTKLRLDYKYFKNEKHTNQTLLNTKYFNENYNNLFKRFNFTQNDFQKIAKQFKDIQFKQYLDSDIIQKTSDKLFLVLKQYLFGKKGRPNFKSYNDFSSIEGKSNDNGLTFRGDKFVYKKRKIPCIFDLKDTYGVQSHALTSRIKFCSLKIKEEKGKENIYLYLHLEGEPLLKDKNKTEKKNRKKRVSLDLGPSSYAIVGENKFTELGLFSKSLSNTMEKRKVLQKKLQHKLRKNNPKNFEKDFEVKKGRKLVKKKGKIKPKTKREPWVFSKSYLDIKKQVKELFRVEVEQRRIFNHELANKSLKQGNIVHLEKINYKSWQKMWGKSILNSSVSYFVKTLNKKSLQNKGYSFEFPIYQTRLSQTCLCGSIKKKTLKERFHICECSIYQQRDLFSAYLGLFVDKSNNLLDIDKASKSYPRFKQSMNNAVLKYQTASSLFLKKLGFTKTQIEQFALLNSNDNTSVMGNIVSQVKAESSQVASCGLSLKEDILLLEKNTLKYVELENYSFSKLKPTHFSVW